MPTALIIGAGSNIGQATAQAFAKAGYTVAVASRSAKTGSEFKHFTFDASKPETTQNLFAEVRKAVGTPSVVIYNGKTFRCFRVGIMLTHTQLILTISQSLRRLLSRPFQFSNTT